MLFAVMVERPKPSRPMAIGPARFPGARLIEADRHHPRGIRAQPFLLTRQNGSDTRSANDGTITRFGWKAQNKSLLMFASEAYNVEMGVTNQLFPQY